MFRYQKILLPLDGSELAERALAPAIALANGMSATVVLLRVVPPPIRDIHAERYRQMALEMSEEQARSYLRTTRFRLSEAPVPITIATVQGPVAESIIDYGLENDVDLIVMSSHGRSGISRWLCGSVAEKVLRRAPCATLIIPARTEVEPFARRRFLVPLDGSRLAERALAPALAIAESMATGEGATVELILLRVVAPIHLPVETVDMVHAFEQIEITEWQDAEAYLRELLAHLPHGRVPVKVELLAGPIAESIVDYAASQNVDLIVICSHGRSAAGRWFFGSVAEKVLRGTPCAILIIRAQQQPEATQPSESVVSSKQ